MTIDQLAADITFDPDETGVRRGGRDPKPWGSGRRTAANTARCRRATACVVAGCGVAYSPGGVCGYCRAKVRVRRAGGKAGAA